MGVQNTRAYRTHGHVEHTGVQNTRACRTHGCTEHTGIQNTRAYRTHGRTEHTTSETRPFDHSRHLRPEYGDAMLRLRHFVAREKPYFEDRIDPKGFFRVFVVEPRRMFLRLHAQFGAFLMSGFHTDFDAEKVDEIHESLPLYGHLKFDIPYSAKDGIIRRLDMYGINEASMFPELEGAARGAVSRRKRMTPPSA